MANIRQPVSQDFPDGVLQRLAAFDYADGGYSDLVDLDDLICDAMWAEPL